MVENGNDMITFGENLPHLIPRISVARFLSISKFVPVFNLLNTTILDAGIRER
jgi:hypothetical protein